MEFSTLFLNDVGRLRSGWRLAAFTAAFITLLLCSSGLIFVVFQALPGTASFHYLQNITFRLTFLGAAVLVGWICNYWLEDLPWRALGLSFHSGWWRDLLIGSLIGVVSLTVAVLIAFATGRLRFSFSDNAMLFAVARALVGTAILFIVAALAEEVLFRGYPLQTTIRAHLVAFGILITSVLPFAAVHLKNPNFNVLAFTNTALAGVLFAIAYLKTRSLWLPLGIHWAWNWAQGSIFGLAVSGLSLSGHPVLHAVDNGPAWLTGGAYGIEGGAACTIALLLSTLFIWRTGLVSATPELMQLTSEEKPVERRSPFLSGEL